jgi:hypothetical protein
VAAAEALRVIDLAGQQAVDALCRAACDSSSVFLGGSRG